MAFNSTNRKYSRVKSEELELANTLVERLSSKRVRILSPATEPITPKVVWEIQSFVQLTIHRVVDLTNAISEFWERNRPAVSFILTRAILENAAVLFDVTSSIETSVKQSNFPEIHEAIVDRLVGGKHESSPRTVPNILSAIDKVDKVHKGFRIAYDDLSEYVHPNYSGMQWLYGKLNKEKIYLELDAALGANDLTLPAFFIPLASALQIINQTIERLESLYPAIWELSEEDRIKGASPNTSNNVAPSL